MKHYVVLLSSIVISSHAWADMVKGDPAKGQVIVDNVCGACHGTNGNSTAAIYPNLAGQYPEYIFKQLTEFKSGARKNATMAPNAAKLSPDDMRNVAAYFSGQQVKPRMNGNADLAKEGEKLYKGGNPGSGVPACASCHGPTGAGIPVQFPRLASQHAKYVLTQLQNFRSGDRSNDGGKMMQTIARKLTPHEMDAVAEYISGLR